MFHIGQHISQTLREQGRTVTSTPARMISKGFIPQWFGGGGTSFFGREAAIFFPYLAIFLPGKRICRIFAERKRKRWND